MLEFLRRWFGRRGPAATLPEIDAGATRIIVGLGNPGSVYAETRHNLGFRCVDLMAREAGQPWSAALEALRSEIAVVRDDPLQLLLSKPQTFMNRSGEAVRLILDHFAVPAARCLIVYDDMDLPFGALRLRERGSAGTHNGMRSVVAALQTEDIPRLRIGISQARPGEARDHVLSEFAATDQAAVEALIGRAAAAARDWAIHGATIAMNRYNKG